MSAKDMSQHVEWYRTNRPLYAALAENVKGICDRLLAHSKIENLSITYRAKTLESFTEKMDRKGYSDPKEEMTDLAGVRIITFIESDAVRAAELVRSSFKIYPGKSLDKSTELGVNQVGYRSIHYVCDLGEERLKLPEMNMFKELVFEMQIRTVLQHAWAEIEHDRNYKLSGILPPILQRRLHLVAGSLELADREFNAIASEVDQYAEEVAVTAKQGKLETAIDSISLLEYFKTKVPNFPELDRTRLDLAVNELRDYGIQTLEGLNKICKKDLTDAHNARKNPMDNLLGIVRLAMMLDDLEKYLNQVWKNHFQAIVPYWYETLVQKYGKKTVNELLKGKIKLVDERTRQLSELPPST
jgi:putative GTP pyrophosphokinase